MWPCVKMYVNCRSAEREREREREKVKVLLSTYFILFHPLVDITGWLVTFHNF